MVLNPPHNTYSRPQIINLSLAAGIFVVNGGSEIQLKLHMNSCITHVTVSKLTYAKVEEAFILRAGFSHIASLHNIKTTLPFLKTT